MKFLSLLLISALMLARINALTVSEYFQLFNVNDINNKNNHLSPFPIATNSDNDVILSTSSSSDNSILTLQIDYNGFMKIEGSSDYLTIDTLDNNKLKVSSETDRSHIFFITSNQLHFDQYFIYVACPQGSGDDGSNEYELYVGNDKSICDNGVLINLRPVSAQTSNVISSYVPDILRTSQGLAIAGGSSISYLLTDDGRTSTVDLGGAVSPALTTGTASTDNDDDDLTVITEVISNTGDATSTESTNGDKTTTIIHTVSASQTANVQISLFRSYKLSTYYSTTLIPYTSSYSSKGIDTVVVVTTIHTSSSQCETTVATSYVMATSTASKSTKKHCSEGHCSSVTATVTLSDFTQSSSLSLLTSLNNTGSSSSLELLTTGNITTVFVSTTSNETASETGLVSDTASGNNDDATLSDGSDNTLSLYGGSGSSSSSHRITSTNSLAAESASRNASSANLGVVLESGYLGVFGSGVFGLICLFLL